jgi:predicted transcriptional regulator
MRPMVTARLDDDLLEVQQHMLERAVEFAVVLDHDRVVGLLSLLQASIALSGPAASAFGG